MIGLWGRHSLIQRLIVQIVSVVALTAVATILVSYLLIAKQAQSRTMTAVNELIDIVEPTLRIAGFLDDTQLAADAIRGLTDSELIEHAVMHNAYGDVLVEREDTETHTHHHEDIEHSLTTERKLISPFSEDEYVGKLTVTIDLHAVEGITTSSVVTIAIPLISQTLIALMTLIALIHFQMAPKSRELIRQIRSIKPEEGEQLTSSTFAEKSELGILITYINKLIQRVYDSLTNERFLREEQEIQKRQYRSIYQNAGSCIFVINQKGEVVSKNNACKLCQITRAFFSSAAEPVLLIDVLASANHELRFFLETVLNERTEANFEAHFPANEKHSDLWLKVNLTPIDDENIQGVINDISEFKLETRQAYEVASIDPLTQLANRRGFNEAFTESIETSDTTDECLSLLLLDLDKFKQVNDTYGHHAGDEVLMIAAKRLRNAIRENDLVARLGGDEFTIILKSAELSSAERIASTIIESLNQPITLEDGNVAHIGTSIGIVNIPKGMHVDPAEIMHKADELLYEVKSSGRNNYRSFQFEAESHDD